MEEVEEGSERKMKTANEEVKNLVKDLPILYGVGVIIERSDGKVLLGKRYDTRGEGTWAAPGGTKQQGESREQTAIREVREETGMEIRNPKYTTTTRDSAYGFNFVTDAVIATEFSGEPRVMPNEKHTEWGWFDINNLPRPLFVPAESILKIYQEMKK